ncbi:MAG: NosD domain-containing protein [Pirellulaceae bacterium]
MDGNRFNLEIMKEIGNAEVLVFDAIRQGKTLTDINSNIAVMDGSNGPVRVEVRGTLYGTNEVWGSSELVIRSSIDPSYVRELVAWEQSSLEIHGGVITGKEAVTAFDSSRVQILGGDLSGFRDGMRIWHNSSLEMSGGSVSGQDDGIDVDDSGSLWITGGRISGANDGLKVKGYSTTTLASGVISGQDDGISVADDAVVRISPSDAMVSGAIGVKVIDNGLAEIYGGQISGDVWAVLAEDDSQINLFGGDIQGTVATTGGTVNIVGAELTLSEDGRTVTGQTLDGSELNIPIHVDGEGTINLIATYYGDANLDGEFNSLDFVSAFVGVEYEDSVIRNSTWADGDWNGDGEFDSSDMVLAFQFGGYEQGPRAATSIRTVPEPTSWALLSVGVLAMFCRTLRKSRR